MERLGNHKQDASSAAPRGELLDALLNEAEATTGIRSIRVGRPTIGGGMLWRWSDDRTQPTYAYRAMLSNQIVFDIGDNGDWDECVRDTHALWDALNWFGVAYWGSLSGGKGTHTEVFGPAGLTREGRMGVANTILTAARYFKSGTVWGDGITVDRLLLDPNEGSRQVREFGAIKTRAKVLWCKGPSGYSPLPDSRCAAYQQVESLRNGTPTRLPKTEDLDRLHIGAETGCIGYGKCPIGPQCVPTPEWSPWDYMRGTCEDCKRYD